MFGNGYLTRNAVTHPTRTQSPGQYRLGTFMFGASSISDLRASYNRDTRSDRRQQHKCTRSSSGCSTNHSTTSMASTFAPAQTISISRSPGYRSCPEAALGWPVQHVRVPMTKVDRTGIPRFICVHPPIFPTNREWGVCVDLTFRWMDSISHAFHPCGPGR